MRHTDTADAIQHGWRRELPGVPVDSIGVITRIWRAGKLLEDDRRRTLARLGVDRATLDLLSTLRRAGPPYRLAPAELASRSLISPGAITQRVARAEAAGLVEVSRTASGRRTAAVRLSEAGHRLIEQTVEGLLRHENELIDHLDEDQREHLAGLLHLLLAGLHDRLGVPDTPHLDR